MAALDCALVVAAGLALFTDEVVLWFHTVFVLLTLATLFLPMRPLRLRLIVWVPLVTLTVVRAVVIGATTRSELVEIPLLGAILVIVYLGAYRREEALVSLQAVNDDLEERAREERQGLQARLERIQQLEGACRMSISIAHDFNNVLTAMLAGAEDLVGALDGRAAKGTAEELLEATQRGRSLMDELTGYARQPELGLGDSNLNDVANEMYPMMRRLIARKATLELDLRSTCAAVAIDRGRIGQVLANLVVNASDATARGGTVRVATQDALRFGAGQTSAEATPVVVLSVIDDGVGIAPDVFPQIFEAGFSTKGGDRNLGMGLVSVRHIVESSGGSVQIESTQDHGTHVRIEFPVSTPPLDEDLPALRPAAADANRAPAEQRRATPAPDAAVAGWPATANSAAFTYMTDGREPGSW